MIRNIFCLTLLSLSYFGQVSVYNAKIFNVTLAPTNSGGGATCITQDSGPTGTGNGVSVGRFDTHCWACPFTASSSYTACEVDLQMAKFGSPTLNHTVKICSDSSSAPGTVLSTSVTVNASTVAATYPSYAFTAFSGLSASLTSGTKYWVVITTDTFNGSDFSLVSYASVNVSFSFNVMEGAACTSWANFQTDNQLGFIVKGQ